VNEESLFLLPESVGSARTFPEVVDETLTATFDTAETVDYRGKRISDESVRE